MGILKQHLNLESKRQLIKYGEEIDTHKQFDLFYSKCLVEKGFIYRGVSDSKFMLYNSAQRFWILNDMDSWKLSYYDFIVKYIQTVRNDNQETVKKYFKNFKMDEDDFSMLSFIQHHNGPTPLLDFTKSIKVGLYFATQNATIISSNNELDKYISLYMIHPEIRAVFKSPTERAKDDITKRINAGEISTELMPFVAKQFKIYSDYIHSIPILILERDDNDQGLVHEIYSTFNITNQEGLFVLNTNPIKPLEEQIASIEIIAEDKNTDPSTFVICYHIHKNLIPYILETLGRDGVDRDYLFPSSENIVSTSLNSLLANPNLGNTY